MVSLLEKTRKLNKMLQSGSEDDSTYIEFNNIADVLSAMIECNVYILGIRGALLGHHIILDEDFSKMEIDLLENKRMPASFNEKLMETENTIANLSLQEKEKFFKDENGSFGDKKTTIIPIYAGRRRQGTLILAKIKNDFKDEDLILAEYGATIVGIEIMRSKVERDEAETRARAAVQIALDTLSYSEMEAIEHIFAELDGDKGLLVASKIADRVGITRSVIVNALRKFESAGVIESKSLGMKGTYIRVLNDYLLDAIKERR